MLRNRGVGEASVSGRGGRLTHRHIDRARVRTRVMHWMRQMVVPTKPDDPRGLD